MSREAFTNIFGFDLYFFSNNLIQYPFQIYVPYEKKYLIEIELIICGPFLLPYRCSTIAVPAASFRKSFPQQDFKPFSVYKPNFILTLMILTKKNCLSIKLTRFDPAPHGWARSDQIFVYFVL